MQLFSQRDPQWAGKLLLGGPDTIGSAGCLLTVNDMICYDAFGDTHLNPAQLDDTFTAAHDYVQGDLLTDAALANIWPDRYSWERVNGYDDARVQAAVASADTYCYLGLAGPGTHFMLAAGPNLVADPWTGKFGQLTGYTNYGWHVTDMVFVTRHVAAPAPPPPAPPTPLPAPTPVPLPHWYVEDENDLVVMAPQDSLDAAKAAADFHANDQPGHKFVVEDDKETEVYTALVALPAPPAPTPAPAPPPVIHPDPWGGLPGSIQDLIVKILKHFGLIKE